MKTMSSITFPDGSSYEVIDRNARLTMCINDYVQSGSTLTGVGVNGKFKATVSGRYESFIINGTAHTVNNGGSSSVELVKDSWYMFFLDGDTINFKSGGGQSNLGQATATEFELIGSAISSKGDGSYPTTAQSVTVTVPAGYNKVLVVASDFVSNTYNPTLTITTSAGTLSELSSKTVGNFTSSTMVLGFGMKCSMVTDIQSNGCTITATASTYYNAVCLMVFGIK